MVGKEDAALIQQAKELGLYNTIVYFKAAIPYAAVAAEMQQSSALLLFSRFENLPCVILEALCTGLPVISSDVGGIKEVVTATNGMLVESENIAALAAAMCRMMDEYHNYDRQQIAAAASQLFNYQVVGKRYADVCKQITGTTA